MSTPDSYDYPQYLKAKENVDERSLNRRVWDRFVESLIDRAPSVRLLEVGAGVGATTERVLGAVSDTSLRQVEYTLVDINADNIAAAQNRLWGWGHEQNFDVRKQKGGISLKRGAVQFALRFVTEDLLDVGESVELGTYDAVLSQAVLDRFPLPTTLEALCPVLADGGLWYLPIHFDGVTAFEPPLPLDATVERLYHDSMTDEGGGSAGAHTGRRLLTRLREVGAQLLAVGSSDWVVFGGAGGYSEAEKRFLHHILGFIERELTGHPKLEAPEFEGWIARRRRHLERDVLIYVAHQLDILARQTD